MPPLSLAFTAYRIASRSPTLRAPLSNQSCLTAAHRIPIARRTPHINTPFRARWNHTDSKRRIHVKFNRPGFFSSRRIYVFCFKLLGAGWIITALTSSTLSPLKVPVGGFIDDENEGGEETSIIDQLPGKYHREGEIEDADIKKDDTENGDFENEQEGDDPGELLTFVVWTKPKQLPREYYNSADPEWQEFAKLSKNPRKIRSLKLGLANLLRTTIAKEARIPTLGDVNVASGRSWLEIVFPYGPPPLYEASGISIYENQVVIGPTAITEEQYSRLKHMFLPVGVVTGSYQLMKGVFNTQLERFKTMIAGGGSEMQTDSIPMVTTASSPFPKIPESSESTDLQPPSTQAGSTTIGGEGSTPPVFLGATEILLDSVGKARALYKPQEPPRGACVVTGKVEVIGVDGWSVLDIFALYDPAKDTFLHVDAHVRFVQSHVMWD